MKIEERLADLAEHGIGCPQAVKLGGETAVAAWCEQMELGVVAGEAEAEAEAARRAEADAGTAAAAEEEAAAATEVAEGRAAAAIAKAEAAGGVEIDSTEGAGESARPEDPTALPVGALGHVLDRLDRLESDGLEVGGVEDQKAIARQLGAILDRVDLLEGAADRLKDAVDALRAEMTDALAVEPDAEPKPKGSKKAGKK